jgi:hypothetical protein
MLHPGLRVWTLVPDEDRAGRTTTQTYDPFHGLINFLYSDAYCARASVFDGDRLPGQFGRLS